MTTAILGGGISGLATAFYLKNLKNGLNNTSKIILIEGTDRLGGWINTHITSNGTQFEVGPRSLRVVGTPGANTLKLAESLKLVEKIKPIHISHPSAQNRLIKVGGKLHKLPNSLKSLFKHQPPFSKSLFRLILQDLKVPKSNLADDTFYNFVERRFGTEIAKYAIDPMCRGIFAGNAKKLSVNSIAKRLFDMEETYGSVIKGIIYETISSALKRKTTEDPSVLSELGERAIGEQWSVWSLEGGLSTLAIALENSVKQDIEIIKNCQISDIEIEKNKMIVSGSGKSFSVDKVISCLPANQMTQVVKNFNQDLSQILNEIPFVDVAVVNLEYKEDIIKEPGFGYLVPSSEPSEVLGVIYDSVIFPHKNDHTILTVMLGGDWFESTFGKNPSPGVFLDVAKKEIQATFGTNAEPFSSKTSILKQCIPQYTVGHIQRVARARKLLDELDIPLYLVGNSYDGVGINDAIYSSKKVVSSLYS